MPNYIIKITDLQKSRDYYLEYSTDSYSPISFGMSINKFKNWYKITYGDAKFDKLKEMLLQVELNGTSGAYPYDTINSIILESEETLLNHYCRTK